MPRPSVEAERRAQILTAACEVIADKGRHDLRVIDVARAAGVSNGTVHYYFDGRREVLAAAFEFNFRESLQRRRRMLDSRSGPALGDVVDSYLPHDAVTTRAWRVWAELWGEAMRDEQFRAANQTLYAEWRQLVTEIITRGQTEGTIRAGDPAVLANMVTAMIDGLAIQVLAGSAEMTVEEMRATLREFHDSYLAA